jgi:hypothetical protein
MRHAPSIAALALIVSHTTLACRNESPGPAETLIDSWIEAAGGLEAWNAVDDVAYTVTTVWFDSTEAETRRRPRFVWGSKNPQRARIERDEAEGHYVQAHDGKGTVWATLNGELLEPDHKAAAEVLYVTGDVMYWIGLPYKLRDPGARFTYIPSDSTGYAGVRVTFGSGVGEHPGDQWFYYFPDDSPFPVEVHYIEEGRTNVNRLIWADNRQAGPITYVEDRTFYNDLGRRTKQLLITDVQINPGVPDSLFLPPATTPGGL